MNTNITQIYIDEKDKDKVFNLHSNFDNLYLKMNRIRNGRYIITLERLPVSSTNVIQLFIDKLETNGIDLLNE